MNLLPLFSERYFEYREGYIHDGGDSERASGIGAVLRGMLPLQQSKGRGVGEIFSQR